jgi:hypothetical protein
MDYPTERQKAEEKRRSTLKVERRSDVLLEAESGWASI